MPEFEATYAHELLKEIDALNQSIDLALYSTEPLHLEDIEKISLLCEQRAHVLGELKTWRNSTDGIAYVQQHYAAWQNAIDCMEQSDSTRAAVLKEKVTQAAGHLRSTMQQKSVLLYHHSGGYHG